MKPAARSLSFPYPILHPPACTLLYSPQIEVYEAAGSRYAELPSELYDVSVAYIAEAAARSQPALLERALAALAAASAAAPAAIGQVNGRFVDCLRPAGSKAIAVLHENPEHAATVGSIPLLDRLLGRP